MDLKTQTAEPVALDSQAETELDALLDEEHAEQIGDTEAAQEPPAAEPEIETQETEDAPQASDDASDDPQLEDTEAGKTAEEEEQAPPALDPPANWDEVGKEVWSEMTPKAQEYALEREKLKNGEITRRQQENAQLRLEVKKAQTAPDEELTRLVAIGRQKYESQYAQVTDEVLIDAVSTGQITAEQMNAIRHERDAEKVALDSMEQKLTQREAARHSSYVNDQSLELEAMDIEFAKDLPLRKRVGEYLVDGGYEHQDLKWVSARDMVLAKKAMLFDELQKAKATAKPAATRTGKAVQGKSVQAGSASSQRLASLRKKSAAGDIAATEALLDYELGADFE